MRDCSNPVAEKIRSLDNLIEENKVDEALTCVKELIAEDPENDVFLYYLSKIWFLKGEYTLAWKPLDEIIAINSSDIDAFQAKGLIFEKMGKPDLAILTYDRVLEINQDSGRGWFMKGRLLEKTGRVEEGKACKEKALKLGVNDLFEDWYSNP